MKGRAGGVSAVVLGVLLVAAAVVMRFVILPGQAQYPDDVDETRTYEGTMHRLLNASALSTLDLGNLFISDLPVSIERQIKVEDVDGGDALVLDAQVLSAPDGSPLLSSDTLYSIDRKTMEAIPDFTGQGLPDREGLVVGWPIGTDQKDYTGWSDDPAETVTLRYTGEAERGGIDTYVFEASSEPKLIVDEAMLANFPPALPKSAIEGLLPALGLPAEVSAQFGQLIPALPDPVPLSYTYAFSATYWVDPATGVLIDVEKNDIRTVVLDVDLLPAPIPIAEVYNLTYTATETAVQESVDDAEDGQNQLTLFGTIIPGVLAIAGVVLLLGGIVLSRRRRAA